MCGRCVGIVGAIQLLVARINEWTISMQLQLVQQHWPYVFKWWQMQAMLNIHSIMMLAALYPNCSSRLLRDAYSRAVVFPDLLCVAGAAVNN